MEAKFPAQSDKIPAELETDGINSLFARAQYQPDCGLRSMFFRYDNRLNRKRYILRLLALSAIYVPLFFVTAFLATGIITINKNIITAVNVLLIFLYVLLTCSSVMLMMRRLHDLNRPGWFCIGMLLPVINIVLLIYLVFFKGTKGPNQYGPDPLASKRPD